MLDTTNPHLKAFPRAEDVFAEPVECYARHLFPLVSIELSAIDPAWSGWIHLLNTVEPEEETVGKATQPFHNYYLRDNWVGFRLDEHDRYELLGDFRYFYLENEIGALPEHYDGHRAESERHYIEQHEGFDEAKERFTQTGEFYSQNFVRFRPNFDASQHKPSPLLARLGGGVGAGNWACDGFPLDDSDQENVRPLTPEGVPFHFIAGVSGYDYCPSGADLILLFFEPQSRVALFTFDWS